MSGRNRTIVSRGNSPWWQHTTTAILGGSVLFAIPAIGYAQQTDDGAYRLSPIIVNAQAAPDDDADTVVARELWVGGKVATSIQDTPASVSVITQQEIEQRNAQTTEEVLQYTPGVVTDYYGTDDRNDYFQIRGFQATTYRDGMTLGSMRGVREDPYAYERIEVLRGSNSTLFGPADPGGSVNFVSKRPRFERFGNGFLSYGSFDHKEAGIDVGDVVDSAQTLAYRFTGKIQDSDREYDHSKNNNGLLMGGLTWEPTDQTSATLIVDYLNRDDTPNSGGYPLDREYDRDDFFGEPGFNDHEVDRTSVTGQLIHDFENGLTLRANARYSDLEDDFQYVYITDSAARTGTLLDRDYFGTDTDAHEFIGNTILQYDASVGDIDSSTLGGVEYRDASTDSQSIYGDASPIDIANPVYTGGPGGPGDLTPYRYENQDYQTRSVFLTQNLSFYDRFVVSAGVRNDSMDLSSEGESYGVAFDDSDDFSETTVRGALTYIVNDEVSTYVSYVESVAPPTIGVTPERGKQQEIGLKYAPEGMNALFSAAVYNLERDDVTIAVVQDNGAIDQQTVGESRARGLDLEVKAELTDSLSVVGGYSYLDTEVLSGTLNSGASIEGNEFAIAPKHTAMLWGYYTLPGEKVGVGLGARYTDGYYFDAANSAKSDSATLIDAAFDYQIVRNTDFTVNVSNLFDEQHVVGSGTANYYNPGREIRAKVSYHW
jgi:iron complex outermembrane receptor protein